MGKEEEEMADALVLRPQESVGDGEGVQEGEGETNSPEIPRGDAAARLTVDASD